MKNITKITNMLVFIFMALFVVPEAEGIEIEGLVRLTGTSMFPTAIIETRDNVTYYFDSALLDQFGEYQHKTIKIRVTKIEDVRRELADGSKVFIRPTIYEATLIEVLNENET